MLALIEDIVEFHGAEGAGEVVEVAVGEDGEGDVFAGGEDGVGADGGGGVTADGENEVAVF